ncbi:SGNH/GDSL hydrolase family protein [Nocardia concava]|uniref:SGNH/GDSL hydrolase family protein n=1 Tax=Nocardia concava TaxID=257281 RepID=UPI0005938A8D|nr:SGNH/GDSL hydrolase family protein [Nocardia concava]
MDQVTVGTYTEATDPDCIDEETAARLLRGAPWRRLAIIGDSTAIGLGQPHPGYRPLTWSARLADALAMAVGPINYLNSGKAWATSRDVADKQISLMTAFGPDLVFITCGGNDIMAMDISFDSIEANLDELFSAARSTGAQLMTMAYADAFPDPTMLPIRERLAKLNDRIHSVARRHDAIVVDLWSHSVGKRADVMSKDRVHFNMSGHAVLAAEAIKALATRVPRNSKV